MTIATFDVDTARVRAAFGSLRVRLANLAGAWRQVGGRMLEATVPFVPVETGRLVDSLKASPGPAGVEVGSDLIYAGVQNYGWPGHGIGGHHFIEHAETEAPEAALEELAPAMQAVINRVGLGG